MESEVKGKKEIVKYFAYPQHKSNRKQCYEKDQQDGNVLIETTNFKN